MQSAIEHKLIRAIGVATAGIVTFAAAVAPPAIAQSVIDLKVGQTPETMTQPSTCAADAQGLMCNAASPLEHGTVQVPQTAASVVSLPQPLSHLQMERMANILLGLLYFVLPVGFGIGLFLHDRQQAHRMATLEAQIRLLERLWKQTPQG